jgi:hypothetical protein
MPVSRNGGKQLVGELALLGGYQRVRFGSIGHITIRVADVDRSALAVPALTGMKD